MKTSITVNDLMVKLSTVRELLAEARFRDDNSMELRYRGALIVILSLLDELGCKNC